MPVTLDQLVAEARIRTESAKKSMPLERLKPLAEKHVVRGFRKSMLKASENSVAIIAELKLASPSKGQLRGNLHVAGVAGSYEQAGAAALSVLTEENHFLGSLANLMEASAACSLPCLRKDFIVDEYQVWESKAFGADAVLLIASALTDDELISLHTLAKNLLLDVLCEVHDEDDLDRVRLIGAEIIGVNSRDLRTLEVEMETHKSLSALLPQDAVRIAESGIRNGTDIRHLRSQGYQAFLIGELFMREDDPGAALARLLGESKAPPLGSGGVGTFATGTKD